MKGIIVHGRESGHYKRMMETTCDIDEAKVLFATANRLCPDAANAITYAITKARDL